MSEWGAIVVALITVAGGSIVGLAAWRRAGDEADHAAAEATSAMMDAATSAVALVSSRLDQAERRILALEEQVGLWEDWAERVLGILDQAVALLSDEHAAKLRSDVAAVKMDRPVRHR